MRTGLERLGKVSVSPETVSCSPTSIPPLSRGVLPNLAIDSRSSEVWHPLEKWGEEVRGAEEEETEAGPRSHCLLALETPLDLETLAEEDEGMEDPRPL